MDHVTIQWRDIIFWIVPHPCHDSAFHPSIRMPFDSFVQSVSYSSTHVPFVVDVDSSYVNASVNRPVDPFRQFVSPFVCGYHVPSFLQCSKRIAWRDNSRRYADVGRHWPKSRPSDHPSKHVDDIVHIPYPRRVYSPFRMSMSTWYSRHLSSSYCYYWTCCCSRHYYSVISDVRTFVWSD